MQLRTQLEEAVVCKDVVLTIGAIRAGHDPAFLNFKLAENILLKDFTNRTFGCARAPIDHVKAYRGRGASRLQSDPSSEARG